MILTGNMFCSS